MQTEQDNQEAPMPDQQQPSPTIEETPTSQMLSLTIITETPLSQIPQAKDANDSENQSLITTMTQPPPDTPHPTMELTIDKFPTLPTKTASTHSIKNIEDTEFSDDLIEQSPAITSKQPIQTAFKWSFPTYL